MEKLLIDAKTSTDSTVPYSENEIKDLVGLVNHLHSALLPSDVGYCYIEMFPDLAEKEAAVGYVNATVGMSLVMSLLRKSHPRYLML